MDKENRKFKRINKTTAVQIDDSYAMLVDLSRSGMRVIPDSLPKKIENIRISFITENGELIDLQGSIVRIVDRTGKEGKYELGLSLLNVPENYSQYIDALEKGESPRGISQKNLRQDLVKAVLEGKPEGLSLPQTPAAETPLLEPGEALSVETVEMSIDNLFQEEGEKSPPVERKAAVDETIEMSLDGALKEQESIQESPDFSLPIKEEEAADELDIPLEEMMHEDESVFDSEAPAAPQQGAAGHDVNIPIKEMLQEEEADYEPARPTAAPQPPADHDVRIPLEEMMQEEEALFEPAAPPLPMAAEHDVSIPLEEMMQEETAFEPEMPAAPPGAIGGEIAEAPQPAAAKPADLIPAKPIETPRPGGGGSAPDIQVPQLTRSGQKKAAPARMEVSLEEFMQKFAQGAPSPKPPGKKEKDGAPGEK